jgi:hypothetical protein
VIAFFWSLSSLELFAHTLENAVLISCLFGVGTFLIHMLIMSFA